ncbi:hypothetical protein N9189_04530, partial [Pirellulaceae bacterium]|jgi:hypothetical protein|nr:hypothetical protein [Pirellulaceae bacterium]
MWQSYVYIALSLIFIGSGILIGWGLTFSDQFKHIDSKTQEKRITWWAVSIVSICCALVITLGVSVAYKHYYGGVIFGQSQDIWTNNWTPQQPEYNQPSSSVIYTPSSIDYPNIPQTGMYPRGLL